MSWLDSPKLNLSDASGRRVGEVRQEWGKPRQYVSQTELHKTTLEPHIESHIEPHIASTPSGREALAFKIHLSDVPP